MKAAFRHVEEEGVIGSEEKEHRQEAECESLPEGGYRGNEDQYGQNEYVGESIQEDARLEETQDSFYAMVSAYGKGKKQVGAGHELG